MKLIVAITLLTFTVAHDAFARPPQQPSEANDSSSRSREKQDDKRPTLPKEYAVGSKEQREKFDEDLKVFVAIHGELP